MDCAVIDMRRATPQDRNTLRAMQALSLRVLGAGAYPPEAIEGLIEQVGTMDDFLIGDGTYLLATSGDDIVGCGGWSTRQPGYGRRMAGAAPAAGPAARVRSVYVHPGWARRGIARRLMARLEEEIAAAGFERATLVATLTGVPFYRRLGYSGGTTMPIELAHGLTFAVVPMEKPMSGRTSLVNAA